MPAMSGAPGEPRIRGDDAIRRRRPRQLRSHRVSLRIDDETAQRLGVLAGVLHVSKSAVIRLALHEGIADLEARYSRGIRDTLASITSDTTDRPSR